MPDKHMFMVSVPGKVILHGEHSVVYGKTALAASINLRTKVKVNVTDTREVSVNLPNINVKHHFSVEELKKFIHPTNVPLKGVASDFSLETPEQININEFEKSIREFLSSVNVDNTQQENAIIVFILLFAGMFSGVDIDVKGVSFELDTELTIGAGTGSSASYSVCLACAIFQLIRIIASLNDNALDNNISRKGYKMYVLNKANLWQLTDFERDIISRWAFMSEKIMHGNPSGIDNSVCTYGSVIQFKKNLADGKVIMDKISDIAQIKILLVDTRVSRNTANMVRHIVEVRERYPKTVDSILDALDDVAMNAAEILKCTSHEEVNIISERLKSLEELVDINQYLLAALGVSHPSLNKICDISLKFGLHSKLTGGGGGGYAIVLLKPDTAQATENEVTLSLQEEGFSVTKTELGAPGVYIKNLI